MKDSFLQPTFMEFPLNALTIEAFEIKMNGTARDTVVPTAKENTLCRMLQNRPIKRRGLAESDTVY